MTTAVMPFSRLMNDFFAPGACAAHDGNAVHTLAPRADILEGDADYIIRMDVPGVNREDLEVEIDGETLTVSAERDLAPAEGYRRLRAERRDKVRYRRSFELGRGIDRESVAANFADGVLTLTLPKNEQAVARRVEVK
jgi:HSP20 family protein